MKKIKLTNSTILIIAGGLFLLLGTIMFVTQGSKNNVVVVKNGVLSQDEANALIIDTTKNIINIYENPTSAFKTEEVKRPTTVEDGTEEIEETNEYEDYYLILNYDEVVNAMFTENGIKELEQTTFEGKKFIIKESGKVYMLKEIPTENRYTDSNITINVTKIQNESIVSEITLTSYKLNDDMLTYYAIVKNLTLIKKDNTWLVDGFYYNNK
ncbi:MAG: hypothetical protein IKO78_06455 [Bacilli bacterium]|nr:hypothetical protein [Bacilli bacterium]